MAKQAKMAKQLTMDTLKHHHKRIGEFWPKSSLPKCQ